MYHQASASAVHASIARRSPTCVVPVVFIVNNSVAEREALENAFGDAGWHTQAFSSVDAFLGHARGPAPSCLVLDGFLREQSPLRDQADLPVICLTGLGDVAMTVRSMKAGAVDVLAKPVRTASLVEAVREALDLSAASLRQGAEQHELQARYASLSERERQVMELVVSGLLNKQVGGELGISEITVKAHRGRVMRKMMVRSLADLVRMAGKLQFAAPIAAH
jgi:FixJ family two-component response regulator